MHKGSITFHCWRSEHPSNDSRVAVHANVHFTWKEALGLKDEHDTIWIHSWEEILTSPTYPDNIKVSPTPALPTTSSTPPQIKKKTRKTSEEITKTVVILYVDELLRHLPFDFLLGGTKPSLQLGKLQRDVSKSHNLELSAKVHASAKEFHDGRVGDSVQVGDAIPNPRVLNKEGN